MLVLMGIVVLSGSNPFFHAKKAMEIEMTAITNVNSITEMIQIAMNSPNMMVSTPVAHAKRKFKAAMKTEENAPTMIRAVRFSLSGSVFFHSGPMMPKARSVVIFEEIMHARPFAKPFRGGTNIRNAGMAAQKSVLNCRVIPATMSIKAAAIRVGVPSFNIRFRMCVSTLSNSQNDFCNYK